MKRAERKLNNKGFSLVELIIVIAIMAILVGVVGTQVLPYMEKSRKAKDMQVVSAIGTAAVTAFAEHAGEFTVNQSYTYADAADHSGVNSKFDTTLKELLGVSGILFDSYLSENLADTTATKLESKVGKTATSVLIKYTVDTGEVTVQLMEGANKILDEVKSK